MPRWTGRARVIADRLPPYSLYRLNAGSGFLIGLGGLVKAGVKIPDCLALLARGSSPWFRERMQRTLAQVREGKNLGEALHSTKLEFPDAESVLDLRAYATLKGFDEALDALGRESMETSIEKINAQCAMMRNVAILLLAVVFAWIGRGIFDLNGQVVGGM
jgi:type II secretory pathway component PulF